MCSSDLATINAGVTGWRIALATDAHFGEADPEVISAVTIIIISTDQV